MIAALADVYVHNIDPFALQFGENVGIRWYGLSYILGFLAAYMLMRRLTQRGRTQLAVVQVADLIVAVAIGTVLGGRLGYCLFYDPHLFIDFSPMTIFGAPVPMWGAVKIWDGGMASHGGLLGIVIACIIYARRHGLSALHLLDLCALSAGIGIFFGRIANFVNGELLGRTTHMDLPWLVKFPQEILDYPTHAPHKLPQLTPIVRMLGPERLGVDAPSWLASDTGTIRTVLQRIVDATQQHTPLAGAVIEKLRPILETRHPSQIYAALLEGALVFVTLLVIWRRPRKPGIVGGWFLILYAVVRIFDEQFRRPDLHIQDQEFAMIGLTRGQLLSVAMLLAGIAYAWLSARRPSARIGGWGKDARPAPADPPASPGQ